MGEREDNVYKAKLTEQAERYDGKLCVQDELTNRRTLTVISQYNSNKYNKTILRVLPTT